MKVKKYIDEKAECKIGDRSKITLTYNEYREMYHLQRHDERMIYHAEFINQDIAHIIKSLIWEVNEK